MRTCGRRVVGNFSSFIVAIAQLAILRQAVIAVIRILWGNQIELNLFSAMSTSSETNDDMVENMARAGFAIHHSTRWAVSAEPTRIGIGQANRPSRLN